MIINYIFFYFLLIPGIMSLRHVKTLSVKYIVLGNPGPMLAGNMLFNVVTSRGRKVKIHEPFAFFYCLR